MEKIVHYNSFNLFMLHNNSFDNQEAKHVKTTFLKFDILSFMKTFSLLPTYVYTYIYIYTYTHTNSLSPYITIIIHI